MASADGWHDPKIWISLGSLGIGACGFIYGVLSAKWNRRESRMDALGKVLQPLIGAAQYLRKANDQRRRCEQLKRSFPDPAKAQEARQRVELLIDDYGGSIGEAEKQLKLCEAEYASRSFRFPDKVASLVRAARLSLAELGRLVDGGFTEQADVQLAKFLDDYEAVRRYARGWRLMDPLEGIKKRFKKKQQDEPKAGRFDLTEKEMEGVLQLLQKRATSQAWNTFTVHPPRKLIERPEIATADNVVDSLEDSVFTLVFQDGSAHMLSLVEIMVFVHQHVFLQIQMAEIATMLGSVGASETRVNVRTKFTVDEIMRPEMVKVLLSKIAFSDVASDTPLDDEAPADDRAADVAPLF